MAEHRLVVIKYRNSTGQVYAVGLLLRKETTFEELKTSVKTLIRDHATADISLCLHRTGEQLPFDSQVEFEAIPAEAFAALDACIWVNTKPE